MNEPKYICKWCGNNQALSHTRECHGCWELRHRMEYEIDFKTGIVEKILNYLKSKDTS